MTKEEWILKAAIYYWEDDLGWNIKQCEDYAESLYQTYVEDDQESSWSPINAVWEDMSYWEE